jgi:cytochrome c biogenesis protein CcmG/thiol:disulfide interchange protein DsbE
VSPTRTKPPTRRTTNRRPPAPARRPPWLWIALGIAVTLAAVVAVVASGGSDPTSSVAGVEETRDVEATGTALAPLGAGPDAAVGQPAPVVHGASFDGTPVTIGLGGRATVIVFLAHWCPHCQREVPLLRDHLADHPMASGVELVSVVTSTTPDRPNYPPSAWLDREGWPGSVLADSADGRAARAFGLTVFPYFVALDAHGEVVGRTSGEISTEQFDQLVSLALGTGSP